MRAVHRVAAKVCLTQAERKVFCQIGTAITREESKENVKKLFMVLSGQHPLSDVTATLPVIDTDNDLIIMIPGPPFHYF